MKQQQQQQQQRKRQERHSISSPINLTAFHTLIHHRLLLATIAIENTIIII
jgi:hypothetical protein